MAIFLYKALAENGQFSEGRLDAAGRQEALRQLESRGLKPVRLAEQAAGKVSESGGLGDLFKSRQRKVSRAALENFMRQLSSLLSAGVSLSRALQILARESSQPAATAQWKSIHDLVIDGTSLADAMGRFPETFPRVYVAMVRAGEAGGFLDLVLGQIADFQALEKELRGKVTSALIYPAVLLGLLTCVMIFLLTFFIPRFQVIFKSFGVALPLLTRIILAASAIVTNYGPLVVVVLAILLYAARQYMRSETGRRNWDHLVLNLPLIGPLGSRYALARFCRMLGTLTKSGVSLITSLRVSRDSIGNQVLVDALGASIDRVQKGDALAASLSECKQLFPGSVIEMISVAEESGRLDVELVRLADVTEREMDGRLRTAVSLAEPLLLFLMAGLIGTIFIGMVIPIFTIEEYIK